MVWSILGVFSAGLPPKIPEGLRTNWECFLSRSAGLWWPAPGFMRDAPAAPTDWDLGGVASFKWCNPFSILSDFECRLDPGLWPELFSFPFHMWQPKSSNQFKRKYPQNIWIIIYHSRGYPYFFGAKMPPCTCLTSLLHLFFTIIFFYQELTFSITKFQNLEKTNSTICFKTGSEVHGSNLYVYVYVFART